MSKKDAMVSPVGCKELDVSLKDVLFPAWSSTKPVTLTRAKAGEYLNTYARVPFERPLREGHHRYLNKQMVDDNFNWGIVEIMLCACAETDKTYRVNGQHTCTARNNLPLEFGDPVVRCSLYYADTLDQVRKLYASIDRGASRTRGHVASAYLLDKPPFEDVPVSFIKQVVEGYSFWKWADKDKRSHTVEEIATALVEDHFKLMKNVIAFYKANKKFFESQLTARAPVIGAFLATMDIAPMKAPPFWVKVLKGAGLNEKDPEYALREKYLTKRLLHRASEKTTEESIISSEIAYCACLHAWNAFREQRTAGFFKGLKNGRPNLK